VVISRPESLVTCSTETLITTYKSAWRYIIGRHNMNLLHHENVKQSQEQ
jgi:hypothetical protein